MRLVGQFIVDGAVDVPNDNSSSSGKKKKPKIKIPELPELKWILPPNPRDGSSYKAIKAFAEGMGYKTVEHDDFSYPGRPL